MTQEAVEDYIEEKEMSAGHGEKGITMKLRRRSQLKVNGSTNCMAFFFFYRKSVSNFIFSFNRNDNHTLHRHLR